MLTLKNEAQDKQSIIEQGLALYRRAFWISLPFSTLASILIFIPHYLFDLYQKQGPLWLWISLLILGWVGGLIFLSALIFRLYCFSHAIPTSFGKSLQQAILKLPPLLTLLALYSLIILGATMVFIIPGVIFSISLMFSFILLITSNESLVQTLIHSHRLVWGHWWHVFLVVSIPFMLDLAAVLMALVLLIAAFAKSSLSIHEVSLFAYVANLLIQILFIPFIFSVSLILLHDLRQRANAVPRWQA